METAFAGAFQVVTTSTRSPLLLAALADLTEWLESANALDRA